MHQGRARHCHASRDIHEIDGPPPQVFVFRWYTVKPGAIFVDGPRNEISVSNALDVSARQKGATHFHRAAGRMSTEVLTNRRLHFGLPIGSRRRRYTQTD